ncbi:unnamed protein product, partial [Didymodactylos carnosus]
PPRQESSIKHLRSSSLLNKKADELPEITISSFNSNPLVEHSPTRLKKTVHRKRSSTNQTPKTDFTISSPTDDLLLTTKSSFNDPLPSTYKKELTVVTVNDIDGHSSSLDSGYDRSDSQSIVSGLSTVQNSSYLRSSARLTNSSLLDEEFRLGPVIGDIFLSSVSNYSNFCISRRQRFLIIGSKRDRHIGYNRSSVNL